MRARLLKQVPDRARMACWLLGLGILVHLLFLLSLKTGWLNPLFDDSMHRFGPGADFFSIYAAGIKARLAEPLYTVGGHADLVPYAYPFRYAPLVAYTFGAVLSLLPAMLAYGLWLVVCELVLLRNIRLTLKHAPDVVTGRMAAALWLLFTPYYLELYVGQFTFVTASLMFWAYLGWQTGRRESGTQAGEAQELRLADLNWALCCWLKMMPLLYLPISLLRGRWKAAVGTLTILLVSSAAYFACHPKDWKLFAAINFHPHPGWNAANQGLMALLYGAVGQHWTTYLLLRALVLGLLAGVLLGLTYATWRTITTERKLDPLTSEQPGTAETPQSERALLLLYAALSAGYLLMYKDVWEHHYVLLLPPLVLMALRKEPARLWLPAFIIGALPTLFVFYDVKVPVGIEDAQYYWSPAISLLHHGLKPLAPLWLLSGIVWLYLQPALARLRKRFLPQWEAASMAQVAGSRLRLARAGVVCLACLGMLGIVCWAGGAIRAQQQVARQRSRPPAGYAR